ncbi:tetratricopeptide repeat protein [Kutzneria sp. NPDC052558]|uniref:tetratricopeptide repeat protein n=1 Tax=Kutzneria sp. NPDC052558 TaxID=3364121 RepID=UPI0037CA1D5F
MRQIVQVFDAGPAPVAPAQLPPAPRRFTSRQRELEQLGRSRPGGPPVVVLHGVGGVGKTALALRWLHDVAGDFPDGSLFVDLQAFSADDPVSPSDALEWFLVALGTRPDRVPVELAARTGLYRSLVASRSLVVLIDNALSAAQVRPLLPGGSSLAVVTSRLRLAGLGLDGARFVEVGPLDVDASVELLAKVVDDDRPAADPRATRELARLCGGLPIALSLVGARLSTRPRRPLAREASTLREQRLAALTLEGEPSVRILFDLSYQELPAAAARLYRLCSVHPAGDFDISAAAACAGLPAGKTEALLDNLIDANLLREVDDRTFAYHDLLRLHARDQLTDPERTDALRRLAEWYLDALVSADLALHPFRRRTGPRYSRPLSLFRNDIEALAWLTAHRATLRAVFSAAVANAWDDLVWQYSEAFWGIFLHTRNYQSVIDVFGEGVLAAQRLADSLAEARLRSQLGYAHAKLGDHHAAIEQNTEALRLAEILSDQRTIATAYSALGRSARSLGRFAEAIDHFARARDIQQSVGELRGVALCRRRIGQVLATLGRHDEAVLEFRAAAAIFESLPDRTQHSRTLMFLGLAALDSSDPRSASAPLTQALTLMRELGSAYYQAEILTALGDLFVRTDDLPSARRSYSEAITLYDQVGDPKAAEVRSKLTSAR